MSDQPLKSEWRVIGKSVRGAAHVRSGLPNQDRISWTPESGSVLPLIVSISDGHGSNKAFRSDTGAELAVRAAQSISRSFLTSQTEPLNHSTIKRWAEENLPRELVRHWQNDVADDLTSKPFTKAELDQLQAKENAEKCRQVVLNPVLAYGATVLTAIITESYILYIQLGDGDILAVGEKGEVSRPLPRDERLFANETTSLSSEKAWLDFHTHFQVLSSLPPALVLLATDGYANSYRNDPEFLKVGPDILAALRSDGVEKVNEKLEEWLVDASTNGSGDDITVGIVCRLDALKAPPASPSDVKTQSPESNHACAKPPLLAKTQVLPADTEKTILSHKSTKNHLTKTDPT